MCAQSYLILCSPMDCSPSGSSVHGIFWERILEWVACPPPEDLPNPVIELRSSTLQADSLPFEPPGIPRMLVLVAYPFSRGSSQPRNQTGVSSIASGFFTS